MGSTTHSTIHVLEVIGNAVVGGVENHVLGLAQHLPEFGIKVTALSPYESAYTAKLRDLGVEVFLTEMHVRVPWKSIQFAKELIVLQEIDVVHTHLPRAHLLGGLAAHLTDRPAVATFHGMELGMEEFGIAKLTNMHLITVCQQAYAQALALGIPPDMANLIPNGVDLERFAPGPPGMAFREKNGIPLDALLVGFAGRLSFEKGPDQFVRVAEAVHQSRPDIHFAMVGGGPMGDEIRTMVQDAGMDEVFHMAGFGERMEMIYPAFDLFAMTSRVEGMPLAALEAMACGIPTVAMSVGGLLEAVEVGTTGMTSSAEDIAGLADAVLILANDPERIKGMGAAARKRAENLFGLRLSLSRVADLFERLTSYTIPRATLPHALVMPNPTEAKAREKPGAVKRK